MKEWLTLSGLVQGIQYFPTQHPLSKLERCGFARQSPWWMRNWLDVMLKGLWSVAPRGDQVVSSGFCTGTAFLPHGQRGWGQICHWNWSVWSSQHAGGMSHRETLTLLAGGSVQTSWSLVKCKVLLLCWGNPKDKIWLAGEWIDRNPEEKYSGLLLDKELDMTWQCALAAQKATCILGWIQRGGQQCGGD